MDFNLAQKDLNQSYIFLRKDRHMSLNEAQARAVTFDKGPCLVIAGPGSGKTHTLTHRINNLIENRGISPDSILVITFNRMAAQQIKQRFLKMNKRGSAIYFATFHSLFFAILRHAYSLSSESIISRNFQINTIKNELEKFQLEYDNEDEMIEMILAEIGKVKNEDLNIDEYVAKCIPKESFRKIYKAYETKKRSKRLLDFDDFAPLTFNCINKRTDIQEALKKRFKYILIDEFQDINSIQMKVINLMLDRECNIFAVGDDDQSIYKFRGSNPKIMLSFMEMFPDATIIKLNINYRSTPNIIEAANKLIVNNKIRFEKNVHTKKEPKEDIHYITVSDQKEEKLRLIEYITKLHDKGIAYNEMAIFSRTNSLNQVYVKELSSLGISIKSNQKVSNTFNSNVCLDICAYLKAALNDRKRATFLRIINKPMRYITRSFLTDPVSLVDLRLEYENEQRPNEEIIRRINELIYDLGMLRSMSPFAAINYIRKGIGYDDYIKEYCKKITVDKVAIMDDLESVTDASKKFKRISDFLEFVESKQNLKDEDIKGDGVNFYTLHRSKGLEFRVVFIMDVCEDIIPQRQALYDEEIEEERRLFYVGITRAMEKLYIFTPKKRFNKECVSSRFIEEIGLE